MSGLLNRLETHAALGSSSPGFHLSEDDIREILSALKFVAAAPERQNAELVADQIVREVARIAERLGLHSSGGFSAASKAILAGIQRGSQ